MKKRNIYILIFLFIFSGFTSLQAQCGPSADFSYCYTDNATDLVELEICLTDIIEATICRGSYEGFWDSLTVYEGPAGSATNGNIVFGPIDGDFSGTILNTTTPGNCLIFVTNSDGSNSCNSGQQREMQIYLEGCPELGPFDAEYCYSNNEDSTVMFELCGTSDEFISSTICQGEVEGFWDDLRVFDGPSGSGIDGQLVFGPVSGDLSGTEIGSVTQGNCLIYVIRSDASTSCESGTLIPFGVNFETTVAPCGVEVPSTVTSVCYEDDENDEVILEICGGPDEFVNSLICSGGYEDGWDDLTIYEGASGSGISGGNIVFGPVTGELGGSYFSTSETGNCLIFVSNSDSSNSCASDWEDALLVVSNTSLLIAVEDKQTVNSSVYPNPFKEEIVFEATLNQQEMAKISIIGLDGRTVNIENQILNAGLNQISLNTENIPSGIYMLTVETESYELQERIIKL